MPQNRRRAAAVLLVWMALGLLASARMGHTAGSADTAAIQAGEGAGSHCGGSPAHGSAPAAGTPCQWILPLLCCQQLAAADVTSPALVMLGTLWLRRATPIFLPVAAAPCGIAAALAAPGPPALERSVILQV